MNQSLRRRQLHPGFDRLELRLARSQADVPAPTSDEPSPSLAVELGESSETAGEVSALAVEASAETVTVVFDRPLDPLMLTGFGDLVLERVGDGGEILPVFDPNNLPPEELDATGTRLSIRLVAPLATGHYQVRLSEFALLLGLGGEPLAAATQFDWLGTFEIDPPLARLGRPIDLGVLSGAARRISGVLDFEAMPSDARVYRLALRDGHFWRLGLEVTAGRDGSPLDAALALFDESGRALATAEFGRIDAPADPFLFAGLRPGTYFVVVSGTGDLPGQVGGYDLAAGLAGNIQQGHRGGPFTLHYIADTADYPTLLTSFRLDQADHRSAPPTGLTLGFSGPLRVGQQGLLSDPGAIGVELRDEGGRSWPLVPVGSNEAESSLTYLFRSKLPAGRYVVRLTETDGLTDLAGLAPRALGLPVGELASFSIEQDALDDPFDLGALWPEDVAAGVHRRVQLRPGETVTYRGVGLFEFTSRVMAQVTGGALSARLITTEQGQGFPLAPLVTGGLGTGLVRLLPGGFSLELSAVGTTPVDVEFTLRGVSFLPESILFTGLGQGPALNLTVVAPPALPDVTPVAPSPVVSLPASIPPAAPVPAAESFEAVPVATLPSPSLPAAVVSTISVVSTPVTRVEEVRAPVAARSPVGGPTGIVLAWGGVPVGQPASGAGQVTAVTTTVGPGSVALGVDQDGGGAPTAPPLHDLGQLLTPVEIGLIATIGHDAAPIVAIDRALDEGLEPTGENIESGLTFDWLARLQVALNQLVATPPRDADEPAVPADQMAETEDQPAHESPERAVITPPMGIGMAVVLTLGYHRALRRARAKGRSRSRRAKKRIELAARSTLWL